MTKAKVITFSIIVFIIVLASVLFGAVFRVRKQTLVAVGEDKTYCQALEKNILNAGGIKEGCSIFMIDKTNAISKIEKANPEIKVIQIKTVSVTEIEIHVRKRYQTYYVKANGKFYYLDEDLKVLNIKDISGAEIPQLIEFNASSLAVDLNTEIGDFVGNEYYQKVAYNLYVGLYTDALLEREELASAITNISFAEGVTINGTYNRLILQTSRGVKIDICVPETNLAKKINIAFSLYNGEDLTQDQKLTGLIKIYLDADGNLKVGYFN